VLPRLFSIGSFYIPTYGVLVALGFLAGVWVATRLARRAGLNPDNVTNLALYCAFAGILGAKLFMFLFDLPEYLHNPSEIFTLETLQAAGVFHGGFIGALLVAVYFIRRHRMPIWRTMDAFAPGVAIGQAIGRLGCFAAGCCWGRACYLPWGVRFRSNLAAPVPLDEPLHPVQLYESAADLFIFALLYRMALRPHKEGCVIGWYLVLYSTARFVIEFFRNHEQSLVLGLSLTQWIAAGLLAVGVVFLLRGRTTQVTPARPAKQSQSQIAAQ
jgi:phosphatidylglycerol:prolipoprotein diacylglycerol transferase